MTTAGSLHGKVAVVTGGSRGIGAAVAARYATAGAGVVIGYHRAVDAAHKLAAQLTATGARCVALHADVADPQQTVRLIDQAVDTFGSLDILASCAGINHFGGLTELTPADFDRVFAVNTRGQLIAAQQAARRMSDGGRIILTSSNAARRTIFEHALYAASKSAVEAMVRCLSVELGRRGITINAVAPGATATDMAANNAAKYQPPGMNLPAEKWLALSYALGRIATPAEVAGAYAFLAGADAAYITGRTLPVEGCVF
ncbi:SDR family NAD(P)-dependent oxidoreductase [Krasilnikovia sp. MM14-A1259]|uniref:SDR family NAD(P)-dependent oxidoreductase n=1 Tax=Krasilnikovia sp. MM14-A1259 TaxID=3373539 RepID=UPI003820CFAE